MDLADLPSRRTEAWKWSDLRTAMTNQEAVLIGTGAMPAEGPIAALAEMLGDPDLVPAESSDSEPHWSMKILRNSDSVPTESSNSSPDSSPP